MNYEQEFQRLEIENIVWVVFLAIIGANLVSNFYTAKYLYTRDKKYHTIYRTINIVTLFIALLIYVFNEYASLKAIKERKPYHYIVLIANTLILISGLLLLYVEIQRSVSPEITITQ